MIEIRTREEPAIVFRLLELDDRVLPYVSSPVRDGAVSSLPV